jgi:hypothetical protein
LIQTITLLVRFLFTIEFNTFVMKKTLSILIPLIVLAVAGGYFIASAGSDNFGSDTAGGNSGEPGSSAETEAYVPGNKFNDYWYDGKAELSSYTLNQARYGEMREGNAVLVFVTEDFSLSELTKADGNNGAKVPVLKVNFDKKFLTGIYPYSMLMTTAVPVDMNRYPRALKVSGSVQEWCGHTYTQLNLSGNKYEFMEHSYFPGEGDQSATTKATLTEDELWVRIRLAPDKLPVGKADLLPGVFYTRLKHQPMTASQVELSKSPDPDATGTTIYTISWPNGSRTLKISYQNDFPHMIEGWEDIFVSGWGEGAKSLTTKATRNKTLKLDYWNRNKNSDLPLRKDLGLE